MRNPALHAALVLLLVSSCDYPFNNPYDPVRCVPRCTGDLLCIKGQCVHPDRGVDESPPLDLRPADSWTGQDSVPWPDKGPGQDTVHWSGFRCSLREHKSYTTDPDFTFYKLTSSTSVIRIQSGKSSVGWGYCFVVTDRAWLDGKHLRFYWQGQGSAVSSSAYKVLLYDGAYDRSSDVDFPSEADIPTKGKGLLQTIAASSGPFVWTTSDVLIDASKGTEKSCSIFFRLVDGWGAHDLSIDIDWIEINSGSGGAGNLYSEQFTDAVTMELAGTVGDYGYIGTGDVP